MSSSSPSTAPNSFGDLERDEALRLIECALREDLPAGDPTSDILFPGSPGKGDGRNPNVQFCLTAGENGVLAGLPVVQLLYEHVDRRVVLRPTIGEGGRLERGRAFLELDGPAASILRGERTALNFLQHLCGVSTLTAAWVAATRGTSAVVLDTRKTLPGWRHLEKYAVRVGGGENHRRSLSDAIMVKDNHAQVLRASGRPRLDEWVGVLRQKAPELFLQVEVDSREEFLEAGRLDVDAILLDNFTVEDLRWAVEQNRLRDRAPLLEASGGLRLETAREVAATGVDRVSVGQLTHSAPALDISMDFMGILEP